MSLVAAIERCEASLTPLERRLTQALLAAPTEAAFLSVQEIARRAGADAATAVRLAKKLGYSGYKELKVSLQSELVGIGDGHSRLERRVEPLRSGGVLAALIDAEIESLARLKDQMTEARVQGAAQALREARRIFVYGQGHATALVDLLSRRLNRHGYLVMAMREGQWGAPEAVAAMDARDVLVTFAFYRVPDIVPMLIEHAGEVGATSILITDLVAAPLPVSPTHTLAAIRGRPGESHTLGVPMLIVNALTLALAGLDHGRSLAAVERLDELTKRFATKSAIVTGRTRRRAHSTAPR